MSGDDSILAGNPTIRCASIPAAWTSTVSWIRGHLKRFNFFCEEAYRLAVMKFLLTFSARYLPRRCALFMARLAGAGLFGFSSKSHEMCRDMKRAFTTSWLRAIRLTCVWLAQPFCDHVILKRVILGLEDVKDWEVIEENAEAVTDLRNSGVSFIVAASHFSRQAILPLSSSAIIPGRPILVALPVPKLRKTVSDRRVSRQLGAILEAARTVRPEDLEYFNVGLDSPKVLLRRLSEAGNVVLIHVDAPWNGSGEDGSCYLPFAGYKKRLFALGALRLARLSGCPIIGCTWRVKENGTIVLKWGELTYITDTDGNRNLVRTMEELLSGIEVEVGNNPSQYVLGIGGNRKWNATSRRWQSADSDEVRV